MGKGDKKDADRAKAEKRLEQEIGEGQTDEQLARAEKKAEGMGRGVNKGEERVLTRRLRSLARYVRATRTSVRTRGTGQLRPRTWAET